VLDGTLLLGDAASNISSTVRFGDQFNPAGSLTGRGTVVLRGTGPGAVGGTGVIENDSGLSGTDGRLTIGPNITLHGKNGRIQSFSSAASLVNLGTISADTAGGSLTVGGVEFFGGNQQGDFSNTQGTINLAGGHVVLGGSMTLADVGTIKGNGGSVVFQGNVNLGEAP
jgi:hypothetical protein